jgi:hypothetical protein
MKKSRRILFLIVILLAISVANVFAAEERNSIMPERWQERKNGVIGENDREKTTTLLLPPTLEKKDLRTIEKNTAGNLRETKGLRDDIKSLFRKDGKFDQLTAEVKKGAGNTKGAIETIGKKLDKSGRDLGTLLALIIALLGGLVFISLFILLAIREKKKDKTVIVFPVVKNDHNPTNGNIFDEIGKLSKRVDKLFTKVDRIPARTAEITDMCEINLGNGIAYRPPLFNGKRLSLHVPENITGEYRESSKIPRVPIKNLVDMEKSVIETLVKYYNNEYDQAGLQTRVIRYAIENGQLRGLY